MSLKINLKLWNCVYVASYYYAKWVRQMQNAICQKKVWSLCQVIKLIPGGYLRKHLPEIDQTSLKFSSRALLLLELS